VESNRAADPLMGAAESSVRVATAAAKTTPVASGSLVRGLSLLGCVALIVGNMVGTSIYTLPASLAKTTGPLGLVAWVLTAAGYLFVALIYASLGTRYPKTGGPYVFARDAFGEFAGFQIVWAYWISSTIGNAGITLGVVAYIVKFFPALEASPVGQFLLAQALLWGLCGLNVLGVKQSGRLMIVIMFLNLVPLLLLSAWSLRAFDSANLHPFAPHGFGSLAAGCALVVWAYSGIESATVPAEEVQGPERTINNGTLIGYALGTLVFLLTGFAVAGALPNDVVAGSARPISFVVEKTAGPVAAAIVSIGAIIAGLGTLNGWILMAGRIPVTAAADGIFFRPLAKIHPRFGTPYVSLLIGNILPSVLLVGLLNNQLLDVFNFLVLLSVLTTLLPHLYAAGAELMLSRRDTARYTPKDRRRAQVVAPIAFVFVMYTIYGVGAEVALWGFLVVLAGTPLYIWFVTREQTV